MVWTQESVNAAQRALQPIIAERSLEMGSKRFQRSPHRLIDRCRPKEQFIQAAVAVP